MQVPGTSSALGPRDQDGRLEQEGIWGGPWRVTRDEQRKVLRWEQG